MNKIALIKKVVAAIKASDCATVKSLVLSSGLVNPDTAYGTWLHLAAGLGKLDVVKCLVELGADVNIYGGTYDGGPLNEAATEGHDDIVLYLINAGAHLDVSEPERNPLFGAIVSGHFSTVKTLVSHGIDHRVKYSGKRMKNMDARGFALERGESEIAEYLLGLK
jgi:ankyrin repeat protein